MLNYRWADFPVLFTVAALYALLAEVVLRFFSPEGVISIVWPSSGLALAALLIGGIRYWPAIFVGAFIGNILAGSSISVSLGIGLGNTLEAITAVLLLKYTLFNANLSHPRDYLWLSVAGALGCLVGAINGNLVLVFSNILPSQAFFSGLWSWWQGDFIGMLVVTPTILIWRFFPIRLSSPARIIEAITCFGLSFLAGQSVFHQWFFEALGRNLQSYWLFLFAAWAAVRFGRHGAVLMIAIVATQALLGVIHMDSALTLNTIQESLLNSWFFILVITVISISLALNIFVFKQNSIELRESEANFRSIIEYSNIPFVINDDEQRITFLNKAFTRTFGYQLYEIPNLQQWRTKAYPDPTYRQWVKAEWLTRLENAKQGNLEFDPVEIDVCCRDGQVRSVIASASQYEKSSKGSHLVSMFDISDRKRAEDDLIGLGNILESSLNEVYLFDAVSYRFVVVNRGARANLGYSMPELERLTPLDITPDHTLKSFSELLEPLSTGLQQHIDFNTVHRRKDASLYDVEVRFQLMTYRQLPVYVASILDITGRKQAEEASRLASMVYQSISEAVMVMDDKSNIIDVNPAFTLITGYTSVETVGQQPKFLSSGKHDDAFYQKLWLELNETGQWQGEVWSQRKSGDVFPELLSINTINNEDGSIYRRVALFSDISKKKKTEEQIWRQANFDTLTELPNRRMFLERLEHEISQSQRNNNQMAVMFIDLDRFKDVNDTLGHSMGDSLLKEAALRLSSCIRESDTAARFGGDEFMVLLNNIGQTLAVERTLQLLLQQFSIPFELENEVIHLSSSIGVVIYPDDGNCAEDLIKKADQAMYQAKENGRNRSCYFTTAMQESTDERMQLTNDLRTAIKEQQFLVYYQPIVELSSGKIDKAEALLRWPHPTQGFIGPDIFIPIAEHNGLISDIGHWVFSQVTEQISIWRDRLNSSVQVSVNRSPIEFYNNQKGEISWSDSLREQGLPGDSVVVEITEGLLLDPADHVIAEFNQLRDAGIGVSLDDFGTGYSSLAYLKKFDIDYLKIDKTFICNLSIDSEDMALCEAIIVMAHKLGLKVIAEGVETIAQRDLLVAAGCDYGQGYLFSKAVPAAEFELLVATPQFPPQIET